MRVVAKNQLVIESVAPYCRKLTTRKLPNATMKKRKSYMNALNLTKYDVFFSVKLWVQTTFYKLYNIQTEIQKHEDTPKKIHKNYHYKLTTKITTFAFYKLTKSFSISLM